MDLINNLDCNYFHSFICVFLILFNIYCDFVKYMKCFGVLNSINENKLTVFVFNICTYISLLNYVIKY